MPGRLCAHVLSDVCCTILRKAESLQELHGIVSTLCLLPLGQLLLKLLEMGPSGIAPLLDGVLARPRASR